MANKKGEENGYDISSSDDFSGNLISGMDEYSAADKSQKQEKNSYVNLWKKIKSNSDLQSVAQSQKQNEEMLNVIENYVKGAAFKQIMENKTKEAVNKYAKEEGFKTVVNDVVRNTEEKLRDKIDDSKLKTIETLGIFVALFTFVSVEFQIFRIFHTPASIGGLTAILLGSLLFFSIILDYVLDSSDNPKNKFYPLFIFSVFLISSGIYIFIKTPQEKLDVDNNVKSENQGSFIEMNGNSILKK